MGKEKFRGKYRIDSARLKNFDYGSNNAYFITIVTQNRKPYFGEIVNGKMVLNQIGKIAWNEWIKTPKIRPDMNLQMVEFIVMPNHIHGIIYIGNNEYNGNAVDDNDGDAVDGRDAMHRVSTGKQYKNKFSPQRKNLSSIIRGLKSSVTIKSRKINTGFSWQTRFHDRIIRDNAELTRIRKYIINNPEMWNRDQNNKGIWL